jgi:translocator protein
MNLTLRQWSVVALAIAQVVVSGLASTGLIGGVDTGELSDRYPTLVVPAGYTFAIWGPIFLLCIIYAVYQALPSQRDNPLLRAVGWWSAAAFAGNTVWIVVFQNQLFLLAELIIVAILVSLAAAFIAVGRLGRPLTRAEQWFAMAPLGLLFGWITVANVASAAQTLVATGWNGWGIGEVQWSIALLLLGGVFALVVTARSANVAYVVAAVWGLGGIIANHWSSTLPIGITAASLIVALVLVLAVAWTRRRGRSTHAPRVLAAQ